jgi:hypothetical protein
MAQGGENVTLSGDAKDLQKELEDKRPIAFVGKDEKKLHIFNVLAELKLASLIDPIPAEEKKKNKAKDKEGLYPNRFKDEVTDSIYEVSNKPSVIISITGDAVDLPDDRELDQGVEDLMKLCEKIRNAETFPFSNEDARRALLSNYIWKEEEIQTKLTELKQLDTINKTRESEKFPVDSKIFRISYLLQVRIEDLHRNARFKETFLKNFKYPSVRDMLLNIHEDLTAQLNALEKNFECFFDSQSAKRDIVLEPIASAKRISKSRRVS